MIDSACALHNIDTMFAGGWEDEILESPRDGWEKRIFTHLERPKLRFHRAKEMEDVLRSDVWAPFMSFLSSCTVVDEWEWRTEASEEYAKKAQKRAKSKRPKMRLDKSLSATVVGRGDALKKSGNVLKLECCHLKATDSYIVKANVAASFGGYTYILFIHLQQEILMDSSCSCTNGASKCSHILSVLRVLQKMKTDPRSLSFSLGRKNAGRADVQLVERPLIDTKAEIDTLSGRCHLGTVDLSELGMSFCHCRTKDIKSMTQCKTCYEWFHFRCIGWTNGVPEAWEELAYVCGFCFAEGDQERVWKGKAFRFVKVEGRRNRQWVAYSPTRKATNADMIRNEQRDAIHRAGGFTSWSNARSMVKVRSEEIQLALTKDKNKAKVALAQGGHHIADAPGSGGPQLRRVVQGHDLDRVEDEDFRGSRVSGRGRKKRANNSINDSEPTQQKHSNNKSRKKKQKARDEASEKETTEKKK